MVQAVKEALVRAEHKCCLMSRDFEKGGGNWQRDVQQAQLINLDSGARNQKKVVPFYYEAPQQ